MTRHRIAIIVGSFRKGSINQSFARALAKLGADRFDCTFCRIDDLPLFSQDIEQAPPAPVERIKAEVAAADGVLVVTPEYNRTIPGALKNALDWINRPEKRNDWAGKPTAVTGATRGALGTLAAQQVLRMTLLGAGAVVMGQPTVYFTFRDEMFGDDDTVLNADTAAFLKRFTDAFAAWIETVG